MSDGEATFDDGEPFGKVRLRLSDPSKRVVQTKELLSKQAVQTKEILSKQAVKIAKQAEEHERFINKVTHLLGVLGFGAFCYLMGAKDGAMILGPEDERDKVLIEGRRRRQFKVPGLEPPHYKILEQVGWVEREGSELWMEENSSTSCHD
ncbi:hypothetical protein QJS04_geneDACA021937 [Acorus gramineus]|uniref:Glycerophosphocholine acyltransferase 1 n=1 Tax=Acorus gramineus TaxID=55184 RepID=A0AAV9A431_ACOGR|nr:hypothetical protein QJS04_geneDACA021937 [Acorus gramineus]